MSDNDTFEKVFPIFYTMVTIGSSTQKINQIIARLRTIIDKEKPEKKKEHLLKIAKTLINHSFDERLAGFPLEIAETAKQLDVKLEELVPAIEKLPEELFRKIKSAFMVIFDFRDDLKEVFDKKTLKKIGVI